MENISFKCNQQLDNFGIKLNELRKQELFCDWSITCADDGVIKQVHKIVIMSRCSYFEDMLKDGDLEECFTNTLQLSDISSDELELILTFIYTGNVNILSEEEQSNITTESIEKIQKIFLHARYYKLSYLESFCLEVLKTLTNANFCLNMWEFGTNKCCLPLEKHAINFILQKASDLYKNSNFLSGLNENQIEIILGNDHLNAEEEETFEFVLKWIHLQSANKIQKVTNLLEEVMSKVRFGIIEEKIIYSKILSNDMIRENSNISKAILNSLYSKWNFENKIKMIFSPSITFRIKSQYKDELIAFQFSNKYQKYYYSRPTSQVLKWYNLPSTCCSTGQACVKFQNNILLCGGANTNSCALFSGYEKDWMGFPSMLVKRRNHSGVFFDYKIYACGGENASTEYFDLMNGSWKMGAKLNTMRSHFSVSAVNGALYALGGEYISSVEIFDPRKQGENGESWDLITNAATANTFRIISSVIVNNSIFCFNDTEYYEFDTRMNSCLESKTYCWKKADLYSVCQHTKFETGINDTLVLRTENVKMRLDFFDVKNNSIIQEYAGGSWWNAEIPDEASVQFLHLP